MWALILFLLSCAFCNISAQEVTSGNITFSIEHFLPGNNNFKLRTKIQLVTRPDGKQGTLYLDKNAVTGADVTELKNLVDNKGLYTVRIRTERQDFIGNYIISSIPVCALQMSAFKEDFQVYLDGNGNIIGSSYSVPPMTIAHTCDSSKMKDAIQFQSRIRIGDELKSQVVPAQAVGPLPPYLQNVRLSSEEESTQGQQATGKQQTFFQRYWYVILGLLIYTFLTGGNGPAKAEGKSQLAAKENAPAASK